MEEIRERKKYRNLKNFNNSKIYKIVNSQNDLKYVGSTTSDLAKRMYSHKSSSRHKDTIKLYALMNEIGFENFEIILIENFPCLNKNELTQRERYFKESLGATLNMINPCRTEDEKKEQLIKADLKRRNSPERLLYIKKYYQDKKTHKINTTEGILI